MSSNEGKFIKIDYDEDSRIAVHLVNQNGDFERMYDDVSIYELVKTTEEFIKKYKISHIEFNEYDMNAVIITNVLYISQKNAPEINSELTITFTFDRMPDELINMYAYDGTSLKVNLFGMYEKIEEYRNKYASLKINFHEGCPFYEGSQNDQNCLILQ